MSILGVLGAIGTGLGVLGNGISIFGGNGKPVADMGTQLTNSAGTLSAIKGAEEQSALSREVYDYQKALQERIFQREDNAVQRRALDLEKAGLSKTLAAGNGANAGQAVKVDIPQSESALRGQALSQGVQNMLSIAQAKANIALTEANAKKAESEAKINEYDLSWYEDASLPTGAKSGIVFLISSLTKQLGMTNQESATVVKNVITSIASHFGIDFSDAATFFGNALDDSKSTVKGFVNSAGASSTVGISSHGDVTINPFSFDEPFFDSVTTSEIESSLTQKFLSWFESFKRKNPELAERFDSFGKKRQSGGGGHAW